MPAASLPRYSSPPRTRRAPQLWFYGDLSPNPAERRSSMTTSVSYNKRRSSITETGTAGGMRRASGLRLGLDFFKIGKIVPVTESTDGQESGMPSTPDRGKSYLPPLSKQRHASA